jgi:neutral ceramidase
MKHLFLAFAWTCLSALAADFQAGVARIKITPPTPYWLSGYAARTNPAPVVLQDLWAKALALRDPKGGQAVMVTMDLIGLPGNISDEVAARAQKQFRLDRSQLLLNCSHTHCGPAVGQNLSVMFDFNAEDAARVRQYSEELTGNLVRVIGDALHSLSPAELATGNGSAGFAVNRRLFTPNGYRIGVNTNGIVDHTVPVLRVNTPDGRLRAVLFGYACHNTTLGGDFYQINGDYAGQAQALLEQSHPEATALFLMLCGGDQNPHPRGTVDLAQKHGQTLATEVDRVLGTDLRPVRPPLRTARKVLTLKFAPHTRQTFEEELKSTDKFRQRRARLMLAAYDQKKPIRELAYPVQALRLNSDLTFLSLAGEVVMDYNLRARQEFAGENLVVSGYCHEVPCYIPSRRVLYEGGYEPVESMIYYGMPGPFADTVEEKIFDGIHSVLRRVGAKPVPGF